MELLNSEHQFGCVCVMYVTIVRPPQTGLWLQVMPTFDSACNCVNKHANASANASAIASADASANASANAIVNSPMPPNVRS